MLSELNSNETYTLIIAGYAAIVSTFILGWDAYKWLNEGPRVRITAKTGMKMMGNGILDNNIYISVTAVNYGDRATTITNMGFLFYTNWFDANFRRNRVSKAFIIPTPSQSQILPFRFEAGAQWIGMANQDKEFERLISEGFLYLVLYCSTSGKGVREKLNRKDLFSNVQAKSP